MMKYNTLLLIVISLCISCSPPASRIDNRVIFTNIQKSISDKIRINEIIKPVDIVVLDKYLVIQNEIIDGEESFFVYSLDSLDFRYSLARRGHGPEEFIAPALVQNDADNFLTVFDQASFKLIKYQLMNDSAVIVTKDQIELEDKRPLQEIYYCNDSILLFSTSTNELQTYNIKQHKLIDTYAFTSNIKELMEDKYNPSLDAFHFGFSNGKIIAGFHFVNKLIYGSVDDDFRIHFEQDVIHQDVPFADKLYNNRYNYMYVSMTPNFVFAQYVGFNFCELQPLPLNFGKRRFDMLLEVYDCQGRGIGLLELDSDVLRCKVDEKSKRIFTWNPLADFDELLVYDFSVLL